MFKDREEAGRKLAEKLEEYKGRKDAVVLGIPRGGIIVAHEVAKELGLPLDVLVIRKIGFPGQEELALGAVSADSYYLNEYASGTNKEYLKMIIERKQEEAKELYKKLGGKKIDIKEKTVIVVDDGIATGASILTAVRILKKQKARKIIIAVPVAPADSIDKLKKEADEVVCLDIPGYFMAVGQAYEKFEQVETEDVRRLLNSPSA